MQTNGPIKKYSLLVISSNARLCREIEAVSLRENLHIIFKESFSGAFQVLKERKCEIVIADITRLRRGEIAELGNLRTQLPAAAKLVILAGRRHKNLPEQIHEAAVLIDDFIYEPVYPQVIAHLIRKSIKEIILREKLEYFQILCAYDELTGIYNRRYFEQAFEQELSRTIRSKQALSVLLIDIDDFKHCNDTYGHPAGDEILIKTAGTLKLSLRVMDTVGRYGGEEFVVILPDTDKDNAVLAAERLRRIVEKTAVFVSGFKIGVTISIGIATVPEDGTEKKEIIAVADRALFEAKKAGKNRYCVLEPVEK